MNRMRFFSLTKSILSKKNLQGEDEACIIGPDIENRN